MARRFSLVLATITTAALGQVGPPGAGQGDPVPFENPSLLYEGPDPTANLVLPGVCRLASQPEMMSLPPVGDEAGGGPLVLGEPPEEFFALPESELGILVDECPGISENKNGFFQKLSFTVTWLDRGTQADGFGITELDLYALFAVPLPTRDWPLLITPTFDARFLDGPRTPDLPPELYETYLDLVWLPRVSPRWTGILSVAPSYYGDFAVDPSEAWRLTGRGLARFDWIPDRLQLLFGALYLGRQDVQVLPAGGVIWIPSEARRYEMVFPRPKLAHRIDCGPTFEDWLYLGAEFGGNSYAYKQGDVSDIVTLRDYRVYLGLERKLDGGAGYRLEIGYVFSRSIELASGSAEFQSPDTAHLRVGATF